MAKVLITGGAGFIGRHVVRQFLDHEWQVVVLDVHKFSESERKEIGDFTAIQGDINSKEVLREAMASCHAVVHLAARVSVPQSVREPEKTTIVNVEGTENVLQCALDGGVSKVVVASSAAVYGSWPEMPLLETAPVECLSPYAESKATNEEQVVRFRNKGLDVIALRFFNIYGPGQRFDSGYASLIPVFVHSMKNGRRPTVYGTGEQTRDFVHVHDLARAIHTMTAKSTPYEHSVANVASQTQISVLDVVQCINQYLNKHEKMEPIVPLHDGAREGDVMHSCGSNKRIQDMIGWVPKIDFVDGIEALLEKEDARP